MFITNALFIIALVNLYPVHAIRAVRWGLCEVRFERDTQYKYQKYKSRQYVAIGKPVLDFILNRPESTLLRNVNQCFADL